MKTFLVMMAGLFLLAGCTTYQKGVEYGGRAFVEKQPGYQESINRAIKAGRVFPGMTVDEVIAARGNPSEHEWIQISGIWYERWVFQEMNGERTVGVDTLFFRDGTLIFWND